jgi:predicted nucleic acid-binding protein
MHIYVDATTLIALGTVGQLDLLAAFDGTPVVCSTVRGEVTTEPAATNVARLCDRDDIVTARTVDEDSRTQAREILDETEVNGDVHLIAAVLSHTDAGESVAVVSDDHRVRTVADGLGAQVTGTIGVVARAVEEEMNPEDAKRLLDRLDEHGLHMTATLYRTAEELIEEAAGGNTGESG